MIGTCISSSCPWHRFADIQSCSVDPLPERETMSKFDGKNVVESIVRYVPYCWSMYEPLTYKCVRDLYIWFHDVCKLRHNIVLMLLLCAGFIIQITYGGLCWRDLSTEDRRTRRMSTWCVNIEYLVGLQNSIIIMWLQFQTLHTECTVYTTAYKFPGILRWFEVIDTDVVSMHIMYNDCIILQTIA